MRIDRPKIKVPYEPLDLVIDIINVCLLLFLWLYPVMVYGQLNDTIPTHLNAQGEADYLCAKFYQEGMISACLSDDMDMLAVGCGRMIKFDNGKQTVK